MIKHTITVPEIMSEYIVSQISSGQYGNISEYFRDLVRKDQERRQISIIELKRLIAEGEASGASTMTMAQIREEVRKELGLCN
ncbi:MAG TPA: type II toxin-antitoxin system ParD family antitoxin [Thiomicrospira sp.]|nr:type II toxin-antitoxin system ParD family antitoxin [Thiomicrospira sp.]